MRLNHGAEALPAGMTQLTCPTPGRLREFVCVYVCVSVYVCVCVCLCMCVCAYVCAYL
jgi:hypothetical protein